MAGDQSEQRHDERVGERRQRRRRAGAVKLRSRFRPGYPLGHHRDNHEQQPDQRASRATTRHEEVTDALRYHLMILAAGTRWVGTGQTLQPKTATSARSATQASLVDRGEGGPSRLLVVRAQGTLVDAARARSPLPWTVVPRPRLAR